MKTLQKKSTKSNTNTPFTETWVCVSSKAQLVTDVQWPLAVAYKGILCSQHF